MSSVLRVALIRHGSTPGNALHRYVGGDTDEPLAPGVFERLRAAGPTLERALAVRPKALVTSGMLRCRQTATALFPTVAQVEVPGLCEMRFGRFENRSACDMKDDDAYRAWVEGGCRDAVPGGEDPDAFRERCCAAFEACVQGARARGRGLLVLVIHGGTIRAILERLGVPQRPFFEIPAPSACCWLGSWEAAADALAASELDAAAPATTAPEAALVATTAPAAVVPTAAVPRRSGTIRDARLLVFPYDAPHEGKEGEVENRC